MTNNIKIKICGLKTKDAVSASVDFGADYIGFVHYPPSPRHISFSQAACLANNIPDYVKTVLVCVDISNDGIEELLSEFSPNFLQLHGNETIERVQEIKTCFNIPIIKAIAIRNNADITKGMEYQKTANALLFDAKAPIELTNALPGGNGVAFDWKLLKNKTFTIPWMLSGGLNVENISDAIYFSGAKSVDISSGVESEPGIKNINLIKKFIKVAQKIGIRT